MKRIYIPIAVLCLITATILSCKKTEDKIFPTATFVVYNCLTDATTLFAKLNGSNNVSFADQNDGIVPPFVASQNSTDRVFALAAGKLDIKFYAFPDSVQAISSVSVDLKAGGIYSLFVSGIKTSADTLLVRDGIPNPPPATDSTIFVRFVDLARSDVPLNVYIAGQSAPVVQNMAYRSLTKFLAIGVKRVQYNADIMFFEVRKSTDNQLLSTFYYQWNAPGTSGGGSNFLSKAATAVILGSGSAIQSEMLVPPSIN